MGAITSGARVRVTIEFTHTCTWGENTTVAQVNKQAAEHAIGSLERMMEKSGERGIRVLGVPVVTVVTQLVEK